MRAAELPYEAAALHGLGLGRPGAHVAAHPPVQEAEALGHHVANVGQAQQHQRDAQDGVEYGHHLADVGLGRDVPVSCAQKVGITHYTTTTNLHVPHFQMSVDLKIASSI